MCALSHMYELVDDAITLIVTFLLNKLMVWYIIYDNTLSIFYK